MCQFDTNTQGASLKVIWKVRESGVFSQVEGPEVNLLPS